MQKEAKKTSFEGFSLKKSIIVINIKDFRA